MTNLVEDPFLEISWTDVRRLARYAAVKINKAIGNTFAERPLRAFPIPRGGIPAAQAIAEIISSVNPNGQICLTESPEDADIFIDDLVDSGRTRERFASEFPKTPFFTLLDKNERPSINLMETENDTLQGIWISFPWERMEADGGICDNILRILQYIGEDPSREGLLETPERVARSYDEIFGGYRVNVAELFKTFEDGACDEMVILRNIEFHSVCEHHMQPFFGKAHIAYIPDKKVIGVSKLARVLEAFARRLQIQERICSQVTEALNTHLQPKGAACVIEAQHFCMVCRGVRKQHSEMVTSSITGAFREAAVRLELMSLIRS